VADLLLRRKFAKQAAQTMFSLGLALRPRFALASELDITTFSSPLDSALAHPPQRLTG
jgi:hypothetical protein